MHIHVACLISTEGNDRLFAAHTREQLYQQIYDTIVVPALPDLACAADIRAAKYPEIAVGIFFGERGTYGPSPCYLINTAIELDPPTPDPIPDPVTTPHGTFQARHSDTANADVFSGPMWEIRRTPPGDVASVFFARTGYGGFGRHNAETILKALAGA